MAVAFDELQTFIDSIPESPSQDEWDALLAEAEAFDEDTSSLAVEHLHLYAPSEESESKTFDPDEPRDESGKWTTGGGSDPLSRTAEDFPPANHEGKTSKEKFHKDVPKEA